MGVPRNRTCRVNPQALEREQDPGPGLRMGDGGWGTWDPGAVDLGEVGREFPAGIHKLGWSGGKGWSVWGKEEVNLVRRQ